MKRLLPLLLLTSCLSDGDFTPGDVAPDYFELHGGTAFLDYNSSRPLFDDIDAQGGLFMITLGWNLTEPKRDYAPVVDELVRLRIAMEAQKAEPVVYGPDPPKRHVDDSTHSTDADSVATADDAAGEVPHPHFAVLVFRELVAVMGPVAAGIFAFIAGVTLLVLVVRRLGSKPAKEQADK